MRTAFLLLGFLALAACAGNPVVKPVPAGKNRADGIVTLSSQASIYQPVRPDWAGAHDRATKQCRSWGRRAPPSHAGTHERCTFYDSWGRCAQSTITRVYHCPG